MILSANANISIPKVIKEEGGFQNSPNDSGNFYNGVLMGTKYGITPAAYKSYYNAEPTPVIIKNLTIEKATPIYKKKYWDKIRGDEIKNDSVADLMMFTVVNSGTGQISTLKKLANITAGKKIMAETATPFTSNEIKLLNELPQSIYHNNLKVHRKRFYENLAAKQPKNQIFLKGWLSRLDKHVYSGKISINYRKYIMIGGVMVLIVGAGVIYYKRKKRFVN